ncbi:MAG: tetratricopeptide repeat protein, partial [Treponema sp.]|nr:tetratricopeptide repeat protein [Treponema sp.]
LNQLKKFSEDIKDVGDETKIRAKRGEKSPKVPFPANISEDDDSDAFLLGMPDIHPEVKSDDDSEKDAENENNALNDSGDSNSNDSNPKDSGSLGVGNISSENQTPNFDSLFVPQGENGGEAPDLSDFMDDVQPTSSQNENKNAENDEKPENPDENKAAASTPIEELDLDDLLSGMDLSEPAENANSDDSNASSGGSAPSKTADDFDFDIPADSENGEKSENENAKNPENDGISADGKAGAAGTENDVAADSVAANENAGENLSGEPDFDFGNLKFDLTSGDGNSSDTDFVPPESSSDSANESTAAGADAGAANANPASENGAFANGKNVENASSEPLSNGENSNIASLDDAFQNDSLQNDAFGSQKPLDLTPDFDADDSKNLSDADSKNGVSESKSDSASSNAGNFESLPDIGDDLSVFDTSGLDSLDTGNGEIPDASLEVPGDDSLSPDSEINLSPNIENSDSDGSDSSAKKENPENVDISPEIFDTSEMDGMDFTPKSPEISENEFPVTGEEPKSSDDFELDDSFSIPGFSDTDTADLSKKSPAVDTVDFSGKGGRPRNTLTDEEYEQFRKNLSDYPLNLRLAVEDFIAKNEFKDDAVFEIIEKILKKTSARQLATQLEKLLDISINIPRDYERRSFAQYEAYKQSFQYTLKNRIIPAAIAGLILCFVCFGLFKAAQKFIYEPVMASINYKQGYALLENNDFPQSEDKFNEAVSHKPVKKWFFKYADGYRSKKQYERAAKMYKNTLRFFNHDIDAGIQYAEMELYDRANYEKAEEIVKREIFDYHINDPSVILLLGDVFLEWAEVDDSKYELAKNQYVELIQRYGENNLYLSRMLRYYIRMDKLRDVLNLKNRFYPNVKSLSSDDWTELSGYLLEKLYGKLSRNDEYLRSYIEDVRSMLEIAVSSNPQNPVARYNLARYFVNTGYSEQAKSELEHSLDLFDSAKIRTKKNIYREINASRILGEIYAGNREYLKAQEVYTRGADLYNDEHETAGFEGDENTGKLFADLGDIDYFISGENDSALYNYEKATQIKNDTPSVNYRIGAIYYGKGDFENALSSFIKVHDSEPNDSNVLLSLGNTLSLRGDNFAAQSYYKSLLSHLNLEKARRKILLPQEDEDEGIIVDLYLKASNNLGVALYKVAQQTGNSQMNADAMVRFADSMKAWDALTRNPRTMVRMEGGNLAEQNSKYITHSYPEFEPAIYTEIPKILSDEKMLE